MLDVKSVVAQVIVWLDHAEGAFQLVLNNKVPGVPAGVGFGIGDSFPNGGIANDQMSTSVAFTFDPTTLPSVQFIALTLPGSPLGIDMFQANARSTRAVAPDELQLPIFPSVPIVRVCPDDALNSLFENWLPQLPASETKALMFQRLMYPAFWLTE